MADNINIEGFTIQNSINRGIIFYDRHNIRIINNIILNNRNGIEGHDSTNCYIDSNIVSSSKNIGIELSNYYYNTSSYHVITNNIIQSKDFGLSITGDYNEIKYNIFSDNLYGFDINGHNNIISNNYFYSNRQIGLSIYGSKNHIISNTFENHSKLGIYITTHLDNAKGISRIKSNNFINNEISFYHMSIIGITLFRCKQNYWDDWTGTGPKVIYGKTIINSLDGNLWLKFDWRPAKEPYDIQI